MNTLYYAANSFEPSTALILQDTTPTPRPPLLFSSFMYAHAVACIVETKDNALVYSTRTKHQGREFFLAAKSVAGQCPSSHPVDAMFFRHRVSGGVHSRVSVNETTKERVHWKCKYENFNFCQPL